jgi:hypothetical protein
LEATFADDCRSGGSSPEYTDDPSEDKSSDYHGGTAQIIDHMVLKQLPMELVKSGTRKIEVV